jgi:hypothetical protein
MTSLPNALANTIDFEFFTQILKFIIFSLICMRIIAPISYPASSTRFEQGKPRHFAVRSELDCHLEHVFFPENVMDNRLFSALRNLCHGQLEHRGLLAALYRVGP